MAKKDKAGFNTPFSGLKKAKAEQAKVEKPKVDLRAPAADARKSSAAGRKPMADSGSPKADSRGPKGEADGQADPALSRDESEEFLRAMGSVAQLDKPTQRIEPEKRKESAQPDDEALALAELHALVEGDTPFHVVESEEFYSGQAPGVSHELVERLKEGAFSFRRHVDLHGYTREDGKTALTDFIAAARRDGERCVLVVTGRGRSSPGGISVLREALPRWLSRFPLRSHVLAYCTARSVDGGPGAFYVLLRRIGSRPFGP